jgi:enoyl-CoA hydratase/carnithine racemase
MTTGIEVAVAGDIGTITLNRPQKRNALNRAMWRAIPDAVAALERDRAVRVVILQGAGAHFAGGADISEFDEVYATRASAASYAADLAGAMDALCLCAKPRLAVISGACIGGGVALSLCCDQRFADETAYFAVPPARLGIAYSFEDTRRLVQTVGAPAARDLLFSARTVEAAEALRLRLIDRVCTPPPARYAWHVISSPAPAPASCARTMPRGRLIWMCWRSRISPRGSGLLRRNGGRGLSSSFLKKRTKKLFLLCPPRAAAFECREPNSQKFFVSFFQKRKFFLNLPVSKPSPNAHLISGMHRPRATHQTQKSG